MADLWTVVTNSGEAADLSSGTLQRKVYRPISMSPEQFKNWLKPDTLISGAALAIWFKD